MPQTIMEMEGVDHVAQPKITLNVTSWHYKTLLYVNEVDMPVEGVLSNTQLK